MRLKVTRKTYLSLLLIILLLAQLPIAQAQEDPENTEKFDKPLLHQALLDLSSPWTVMCVAAHPDDEDGSSLTVLRRKYGVHTVSLFSTFGEGGQNAVGPELYEDLGVIRAHETIAASEVQGSEPHFLGFRDFGFSKSAEETFRAWGERETLRRMVLQIRLLRPDVIITNHDTSSGHGHHQATGRTVLQAFDAAADPEQFPEQLSQAGAWQVQRLFVRSRGAAASADGPPQVVSLDPNETDPIRGKTFGQQALEGLQKHATQGPWPRTVPAGGARMIRYTLARQAPSAPPLPADAKNFVDGLELPETIAAKLVPPTIEGKPLTEFAERRLEVLVSLINAKRRGAFTAPKEVVDVDPQRFKLMSSRLDVALAVASGVTVSLGPKGSVLVPGQESKLTAVVANSGIAEIQIKKVSFNGVGLNTPLNIADKMLPGTETTAEVKVTTPKTASLTVPSSEHLYDGRLFGEPLMIQAELAIEGVSFLVNNEERKDVAPPIEILGIDPLPYVTTPATSQKPLEFSVKLKNHLAAPFRGLLRVSGQNLETGRALEIAPGATESTNISVRRLLPLTGSIQGSNVAVTVDLPIPKEPVAKREVRLVYADAIVVSGRKVGYLPSYDETLERSLAALGVDAKKLTVEEIAKSDLSPFHAIIVDNRGYEAHQDLIPVNNRLLKFVEDGGTLLVFYHRINEWNPNEARGRPQLAPMPIILVNQRVTEEDAPVTFLQPRHPLLNFPNKITQKDFADWVQERGLYFPSSWDPAYTAVLATSDKGEAPLKGGLLVAPYGRGNYIYTSMVWYRQLRAGLPGGYRFFANLISYGRRKED
ncbi:MAG TPA: PIG-L family deacetylase [Pyrinomonadaceae bacterium]|nr:PIG-L family deacetylase [Pyrinomonadaceae bacterium]